MLRVTIKPKALKEDGKTWIGTKTINDKSEIEIFYLYRIDTWSKISFGADVFFAIGGRADLSKFRQSILSPDTQKACAIYIYKIINVNCNTVKLFGTVVNKNFIKTWLFYWAKFHLFDCVGRRCWRQSYKIILVFK